MVLDLISDNHSTDWVECSANNKFQIGFSVLSCDESVEIYGGWVAVIANYTLGRTQLMLRSPLTGEVIPASDACSRSSDDWPIDGDGSDKHNVEFLL
jgi:hypothetical protein